MKIFVCSTVKDLEYLRQSLFLKIRDLGHIALFSENADFPTNRHEDSKTNCIKVTEECDLLVLIIDKRAGIIYNETEGSPYPELFGKSITEAEYLNARKKGKPVCIFIKERTMHNSAIYRTLKNTGYIDEFVEKMWYCDEGVFDFIERLMHEKPHIPWIYKFNSFEDIMGPLQKVINELDPCKEDNEYINNHINEEKIDTYLTKIDELKDIVNYLQIFNVWKDFANADIVGGYNLDETLVLIDSIKPPYLWMQSEIGINVDPKHPFYKEMVLIFEGIRNGKINLRFESPTGLPGLNNIIPDLNFKHTFPDHLNALYDMIVNGKLNNSFLQHYFYLNKKISGEELEDIIVNLLIIFMMTTIMQREGGLEHKHCEVVDALISNENTMEGWYLE